MSAGDNKSRLVNFGSARFVGGAGRKRGQRPAVASAYGWERVRKDSAVAKREVDVMPLLPERREPESKTKRSQA